MGSNNALETNLHSLSHTAPSYINYFIYQKQVYEQLEMLLFEGNLYPSQPEE
jgi:hypothetical protein